MLSYRHSFHAGNFADVLKHIVLVELLEYLVRKEKPFSYIDTHSGAGLYNLASEHANKTGEYRQGIARLLESHIPQLAGYLSIIRSFNPAARLGLYPGSPVIARRFLRSGDRAWLYELHSGDFELLASNMAGQRHIKVLREDGLKHFTSLLPPPSRRALVLIDPSYEMKSDYAAVVSALTAAHCRFAAGVYALWYPVVERERIRRMEKALIKSGIRDIQLFELGLSPDTQGHGMTAAGMIVVNPPWTLMARMQEILPMLTENLGTGDTGFHRCVTLVGE